VSDADVEVCPGKQSGRPSPIPHDKESVDVLDSAAAVELAGPLPAPEPAPFPRKSCDKTMRPCVSAAAALVSLRTFIPGTPTGNDCAVPSPSHFRPRS